MADPLSIASAVVGILAAAGEVIKIMKPYVSAAYSKDTPPIARSVSAELCSSRTMFRALQELFDNLDMASASRTALVQIEDLVVVLTDGVFLFSELKELVADLDVGREDDEKPSLMVRLKWQRKEGGLNAIIDRLRSFKISTLMFLNILQCESDRQAALFQRQLSDRLNIRLLGDESFARRIANVEDAFDAQSIVATKRPASSSSGITPRAEIRGGPQIDKALPAAAGDADSVVSDFIIPVFKFEAELVSSRPYQRAQRDLSHLDPLVTASGASVAESRAGSVYSNMSLSRTSELSVLALPIYARDISNSHCYDFQRQQQQPGGGGGGAAAPKVFVPKQSRRMTEQWEQCSMRVIGDWHVTRERLFVPRLLRFEVRFQVPYIFVCPASTPQGPVHDAVIFIDGTADSQARTRASTERGLRPLCSWPVLLEELQRMEQDSFAWLTAEYDDWGKRHGGSRQLPRFSDRDLVVAVQARPRSWATMPLGAKRPFATTTMGHLVEMAALLGLRWRDLDRSGDRYRAEGNGYLLTGRQVPDFGLVLAWQVVGRTRFTFDRVVPSHAVKQLAFGMAERIQRSTKEFVVDERRRQADAEPPRLLVLGSLPEIAKTTSLLGCNTHTAELLADASMNHTHLFHVSFEILGMLAKVACEPGLLLHRIPNPTPYSWDKTRCSAKVLLGSFDDSLRRHRDAIGPHSSTPEEVSEVPFPAELRRVSSRVSDTLRERMRLIAPNNMEEDREEILTVEQHHALIEALEWCDHALSVRWPWVRLVVREHLQQVLLMLNEDALDGGRDTGKDDAETRDREDDRRPTFATLGMVSPERRSSVFLDIYFSQVLPRVVSAVSRDSVPSSAAKTNPPRPRAARSAQPSSSGAAVVADDGNDVVNTAEEGEEEEAGTPSSRSAARPAATTAADEEEEERERAKAVEDEATCVWLTLVFRMLCWLTLHEFHPDDRQICSIAELWGSRMPVYID